MINLDSVKRSYCKNVDFNKILISILNCARDGNESECSYLINQLEDGINDLLDSIEELDSDVINKCDIEDELRDCESDVYFLNDKIDSLKEERDELKKLITDNFNNFKKLMDIIDEGDENDI